MHAEQITQEQAQEATPPATPLDVKYTASDLLPQIQAALDSFEYGLASRFAARAVQLAPEDAEILELAAGVFIECAEKSAEEFSPEILIGNAKNWLAKSVELKPDSGAEKYLTLGQLDAGLEAVEWYKRGIEILESETSSANDQTVNELISRRISSALCSMTEIYMTDCCDLDEAEQICEDLTSKAIAADASNPEVWTTLASVRMSQCRTEDARDAIMKGFELWKNIKPGEPNCPPFPHRLAQSKLLLELSPLYPDLFEHALFVIQTLQTENDQDPEVWYLFGWTYWLMGGGMVAEEELNQGKDVEDVRKRLVSEGINGIDEWQDARECLETCIKLGEPDSIIYDHSQQLLSFLNEYLPEKADVEVEDDVDVDMGADDWEDDADM